MAWAEPISAGEKAAAGFARKQQVDPGSLVRIGDYYGLHKKIPGRAVCDILAETLPATVLGIQWPKTMYWSGGKSGPRFIRPIRWIVALLEGEVIPFEMAGVKSGTVTRGHRTLGSFGIPVNFGSYETDLRKNFVILSTDERRHKIVTEITQLGAKLDADLIETLTFITEYPTAIRGDFDPAFLELFHHLSELLKCFHVLIINRKNNVAAAYARACGNALRIFYEDAAGNFELIALLRSGLRQRHAKAAHRSWHSAPPGCCWDRRQTPGCPRCSAARLPLPASPICGST